MPNTKLSPLLALIVVLAACAGESQFGPDAVQPPGDASAETNDEDAAPAASDDEAVVAAGETAAMALTRELMGRVSGAVAEGGPTYAIGFCSEQALPLTSAVAEELGVDIRRTSSRVRNPRNAPDAGDREALAYFEGELEAGNALPQHLVRRDDGETRYYRPIVVAEFCTACHGPRDALDPDVREILDSRYPDDRATGYAAGDFRGLIRVSVPGG
ncbi:MAG: DUF3365 domain-containing protein [Gammaproteobacteria bacterium]|nr:DUF3365 domain-containing protein [Gammaproteobacteria bacterium]